MSLGPRRFAPADADAGETLSPSVADPSPAGLDSTSLTPGAVVVAALLLRVLAVALVAGLMGGCDQDLPKATEIVHMRILGARVEVQGDETRSTPAPGETIHVTLPTVFPTLAEDTSETQSLFINCTAPDRFTGGIPVCQEILDVALGDGADPTVGLGSALGEAEKVDCDTLPIKSFSLGALGVRCIDGPPEFDVLVAPDFAGEELLYAGVVCERGTAFIDPTDPQNLVGCQDNDGETFLVHGLVKVRKDEAEQNQHPRIDLATIRIDHRLWEPPDESDYPEEDDCRLAATTDALPPLDTGVHTISIEYPADAREEFEGRPEDLEFSVFDTFGELERRFTLFDGDDDGEGGVLSSELDWDPPRIDVGDTQLSRFYFTVLDQRGGFDLTVRAACLR